MFNDYKSVLASKTVWGGVIALAGTGVSFLGYTISPADQVSLVDAATLIATGVGSVVAIVGRIRATRKIG